jgi:hypothetical protein
MGTELQHKITIRDNTTAESRDEMFGMLGVSNYAQMNCRIVRMRRLTVRPRHECITGSRSQVSLARPLQWRRLPHIIPRPHDQKRTHREVLMAQPDVMSFVRPACLPACITCKAVAVAVSTPHQTSVLHAPLPRPRPLDGPPRPPPRPRSPPPRPP